MKHSLLLFAFVALLTACGHKTKVETAVQPADTLQLVAGRVRQCARLYTTNVIVNKIITHTDEAKVQGRLLGHDIDMALPLGERRVAIPITATLKAYVDFSNFSASNVSRQGDKIEITLPNPHIELTATKIDHKQMRQVVPILRGNFTDAELQNYERQGRDSIIAAIPADRIAEQARANAARVLVPMLVEMGFSEENITITFSDDFSVDELIRSLRSQKNKG